MKNKNDKAKNDPKAYKLVRAIASGKNVDAYKILEQTMQEKVAARIDDALKNA